MGVPLRAIDNIYLVCTSQLKSQMFAERLAHVDAAQIDVYADIKRSKPQLSRDSFVVAAKE